MWIACPEATAPSPAHKLTYAAAASPALLIRAEWMRVSTVNAVGRLRIVPIQVRRNPGQVVERPRGVRTIDQVIVNPRGSLIDADQVKVADGLTAKSAAKEVR